ncbi:MAG: anti-sigma factor RsbA family regulatory protein [Solirubrobacteraceae bacterium]
MHPRPPPDGFDHRALLFHDADDYLQGVLRFIAPGLEAGEPVAAAVPGPHLQLLRERLDGAGSDVALFDMEQLGRNPARIIPAVQEMVDAHHGERLHYVSEPIWPGRSAAEVREATRHEALVNLAWADASLRVLCPYDVCGLDATVIDDARRTHLSVIDGDRELRGTARTDYVPPACCEARLPEPPAPAPAVSFDSGELARLRRLVAEQAAAAGLAEGRADELVLAVNEIATNSIRHAGGCGELRIWHAGSRVTCEIRDRGHIADPLAGRRMPAIRAPGGRGLWIANQLCDLVELRTSSRSGTTIRLHASAG